ncbi:MAG: DUF87 domain-containing protein [bacterium]
MTDEKVYLKKLDKLEPLLGSQVNGLMAAFHQGSSVKDRLQAGGVIDLLYQRYCRPDLAEPDVILRPPSETPTGELTLGTIKYRDSPYGSVQITQKQLTRHMGIWGTTGSGKTNLVHILVDQLLENRIPFTLFDWKQNFRSLLKTRTDPLVLYFTVGSQVSPFYWNPLLPPPNTDWEDWLKLLIEAMKHALFLGHGVERILQQTFFDLAGDAGEDSQCAYPTFQEALTHIEKKKAYGREAMWIDSAKRALGALSFGGISRVFNTPFSIGPLLNVPVVYGLESLTDSEKTFFTEALCLWTYFARLNQGHRKPLEHVFLIEEAHNILTRQKQALEDRESLMDGILRQVRELGEGFVIIDQQPSSLTNSALANLNTHFVFNMHNEADIRSICDSIGLHGEDREYLKLLHPGEAIVKLSGVPQAFLAQVPESSRNAVRISDKALSGLMWSYSVATVFDNGQQMLKEAIRVLRQRQVEGAESSQNDPESSPPTQLTETQMSFLESIADYPNLSVVERYRQLSLSAYMGDKTKEILRQAGLITQTEVSTSKGRVALLQLTPAGYPVLGRQQAPQSPLEGGLDHEYWKARIAARLREQGWTVATEVRHAGNQYDIVIQKGSTKRVVEIETGKGDVDRTVKKLQMSPFDLGIIAATTKAAEARIARAILQLPDKERGKIILTSASRLAQQ